MGIWLGAAVFAIAACTGIFFAGRLRLTPLENGPAPGEPPVAWIVAGAALIGALVASHPAGAGEMALLAVVVAALSAIWCTDVRYGIVPDWFTLGPLALVALVAVANQQPLVLASAAVLFVPFAAAAALSKGYGMGWGDVKLAALGGAVLGAQTAIPAFAASCFAAALYAWVCGRRGRPIAFAPFMAAAMAMAVPLAVAR